MFRQYLGLVAVFLLVAASASAESITSTFRGTIDFAGGYCLESRRSVSGFYRFDSTTPGVVPSDGIGHTSAQTRSRFHCQRWFQSNLRFDGNDFSPSR